MARDRIAITVVNRVSRLVIGGAGLLWLNLTGRPGLAAIGQAVLNPVIEVGVVQRFGENPQTNLVLESLPGDRLSLRFTTNGQPQTLIATRVVVGTAPEALPQPDLQERVVLSQHRSFESAEYSAQAWRQRGIQAEIAQPKSWEVWANRQAYQTPLLRRLLVNNLKAQGFTKIYLDSRVVNQVSRSFFEVNGNRYYRDRLTLASGKGQIRMLEAATARVYGGTLRLQPNAYGTFTLVNQVPIETYLRGVVPHEIGPGAPIAAIQAQTILARTYALRNLRRFAIDHYQLCADTQCQVYRGLDGTVRGTDQAIQATRGQVLVYRNELVDALYSSTTGGITAAFSDLWNGPDRPYLKPVVDSVARIWNLTRQPLNLEPNFKAFIALRQNFNETGWKLFRWRYDSSLPEIATDLRQFLQQKQDPQAEFQQVISLAVANRSVSGRVQALNIETDRGQVRLEKDEIVRALSAPRSLLFYLEPIYQTPASAPGVTAPSLIGYGFIGGGWGHGVGLSQTGAYRLANLGWSYPGFYSFIILAPACNQFGLRLLSGEILGPLLPSKN
ncbi:MAG: SpoIID/LytB domain-containing protein [Nodosilinea sp. LVE1205-7]